MSCGESCETSDWGAAGVPILSYQRASEPPSLLLGVSWG